MTHDKAIYLLRNAAWLGSNETRNQIEIAVQMAVKALESFKQSEWIPCSERLPKKEYKEQRRGVYLTTNAYGAVGTTKYEFDGDFGFVGWGTNIPSDIRIIAWMPLPEPYRGGEQDEHTSK